MDNLHPLMAMIEHAAVHAGCFSLADTAYKCEVTRIGFRYTTCVEVEIDGSVLKVKAQNARHTVECSDPDAVNHLIRIFRQAEQKENPIVQAGPYGPLINFCLLPLGILFFGCLRVWNCIAVRTAGPQYSISYLAAAYDARSRKGK